MISVIALIGEKAARRYDDEGEPLYRPSERILLALRWHDWIEPIDLYDQLDLDRMSKERNTYQVAMSRLVEAGFVEREIFEHPHPNGGRPTLSTFVRLAPNVADVRSRARA